MDQTIFLLDSSSSSTLPTHSPRGQDAEILYIYVLDYYFTAAGVYRLFRKGDYRSYDQSIQLIDLSRWHALVLFILLSLLNDSCHVVVVVSTSRPRNSATHIRHSHGGGHSRYVGIEQGLIQNKPHGFFRICGTELAEAGFDVNKDVEEALEGQHHGIHHQQRVQPALVFFTKSYAFHNRERKPDYDGQYIC